MPTNPTRRPAAVPPAEDAPAPPEAVVPGALSPGELWDQKVEAADDRLNELASAVTQREWLLITGKLDRTRAQIGADQGLLLLALAWVKLKHEHGGASWDALLDMTDDELAKIHGYPTEDRPGDDGGA